MKIKLSVLLSILAGLFLLAGCPSSGETENAYTGPTADISLEVAYVDFETPEIAAQTAARALLPQTDSISVTIAATTGIPGYAKTFDVSAEDFNWDESGYYSSLSFSLDNVALGVGRTMTVEAKKGDLVLSSYKTYLDVFKGMSSYSVTLVPVGSKNLAFGQKTYGQVNSGEMIFYSLIVDDDFDDYVRVTITSDTDTNLYCYSTYGYLKQHSWLAGDPEANDEAILLNPDDFYYESSDGKKKIFIGVYGSEETAQTQYFTLNTERVVSESLENYAVEQLSTAYVPLDNPTEIFGPSDRSSSSFQIPLPANFNLQYQDQRYFNVYVSPMGYVSLEKYRHYYNWWYLWLPSYWTDNDYDGDWSYRYNGNSWSHWYWFADNVGPSYPNSIFSLFSAPFHFVSDLDIDNDGELETTSMGYTYKTVERDGEVLDQLIIEYTNMVHRYDPLFPEANRYLSGQIIITEPPALSVFKTVEVEFQYDWLNTDMSSIDGFVGLENNTGTEFYTPNEYSHGGSSYNSLRTSGDFFNLIGARFYSANGGLDVVVE